MSSDETSFEAKEGAESTYKVRAKVSTFRGADWCRVASLAIHMFLGRIPTAKSCQIAEIAIVRMASREGDKKSRRATPISSLTPGELTIRDDFNTSQRNGTDDNVWMAHVSHGREQGRSVALGAKCTCNIASIRSLLSSKHGQRQQTDRLPRCIFC